eukprot:scaffold44631_cov26-Tisochrysis_lutea.AAC.1
MALRSVYGMLMGRPTMRYVALIRSSAVSCSPALSGLTPAASSSNLLSSSFNLALAERFQSVGRKPRCSSTSRCSASYTSRSISSRKLSVVRERWEAAVAKKRAPVLLVDEVPNHVLWQRRVPDVGPDVLVVEHAAHGSEWAPLELVRSPREASARIVEHRARTVERQHV